jgi:hypothetical protein
LFVKTFPFSKLIKDLQNCIPGRKAEMDERICNELLMHEKACIDCIWENRGYYVNNSGAIKPLSEKDDDKVKLTEFEEALVSVDLSKLKYNDLKKLVFDQKIKTKDNRTDTYLSVLIPLQKEALKKKNFIEESQRLEVEAKTKSSGKSKDEKKEDDPAPDSNTEAQGSDAEKKSEGPGQNTQE